MYCRKSRVADYRLSLFLSYPIKRRFVACAPLLGPIDLSAYIGGIEHVSVGGETGREARECEYDWIKLIDELAKGKAMENILRK